MGKNICLLTSVHYPYDTRIFSKEATSLAESGYDVTLIARGEHDPTIEVPDNLTVKLLPNSSDRVNRITGLTQFIRTAIREDADVYHLHDPELLVSVPILKLTTGAAVIYDVHEDVRSQISKKDWLPSVLKPMAKAGFELVERICLPIIDEIILAESSYTSRPVYQRGHIVRNFPKIESFPESQLDDEKSTKLVYIGGISRPRGAKELIELVDRIHQSHDITFQFIGDFSSNSFREEIMNGIEDRNLESFVEFTGRLPFDEAIQQVAKADIGYAILHKEPNFVGSLPTKLFEYMMCGIPVIISDVDKWKQIVSENDCGIAVSPTNISEITDATKRLINNDHERARMGSNGRVAVQSKYRWDNEAKTLLELYDGIGE
jgi:glycosyltransferase involved in cell wall biosynthesis